MKVKIFFLIFLMNVASYCGCGECDCCDCCEYCDCWEKCWGENNGKQKGHKQSTNKISHSSKPKGLYNLGLSCYMNSLLQCLYYIKELRYYFIENKDSFDSKPVCKALAKVMDGLCNGRDKCYEPKEFKKTMGKKNRLFKGRKAADAKDLFFHLIDCILNELTIENNDISSGSEMDFTNKEKVFEETKKDVDENNIINKIFVGFHEIVYFCEKYKDKNNSPVKTYYFCPDAFIQFNLEHIRNYYKRDISIKDCFDYNFKRTIKSSFFCGKCRKIENNMSEERIYKPPKCLVLVLNRGKGKTFKDKVTFDINLNIDKFIDPDTNKNNEQYNYKLIGVSTHLGSSSDSGHYIACCLTENGYYYFSDETVKPINDTKELFSNEPYLLFYERI